MIYPDVPTATISQFNGAVTRLDPYQVSASDGLLSLNCAYNRGEVAKRFGHSVTFPQPGGLQGACLSLDDWTFVYGSVEVGVLVYYVASIGLIILNRTVPGSLNIMPVTGAAGASVVTDGQRLYAAFYDPTGKIGTQTGEIYGWDIGSDQLFASPITASPAITQPLSGTVTAGVHNFAYLMTTRNGFTTMLCPSSGGIFGSATGFSPVAFTASGTNNIRFSLTASLPTYMTGGTIQVVMTTVANPNQYFAVPGASTTASGSTIISFSIDDATLAATATDVTNYMNILVSAGTTPPFNPSAIFAYSGRLGYVTIDGAGFPVVYISDPSNYQYITADQHGIYLEGRQQPVQGFSLRGVCYIGTPHALYSVEDNGDVPVSWTPPQKVDGSIGILSPTCVTVNPATGYAWIVNEKGLYLFQGGIFPPLPVSYYRGNTDWAKINWSAPTSVKVVDDQLNKRVMVIAPFGSSTTPTNILTWDYTEGSNADSVKYSLNNFTSYAIGSIANVLNITTQLREVWYAPGASGDFIRQNDGTETLPYQDVSTSGTAVAYSWTYQTSLIPGVQDQASTLHAYHGMHIRATGPGALTIQAQSLDGTQSLTPAASPISVAQQPGQLYQVQWYGGFWEQETITFSNANIGETITISEILAYYTNGPGMR